MLGWWPLTQRSMSAHDGQVPKSLSVDAKVAGKIVEIRHDDTEHLWGTIRSYDPYDSISTDFHMGLPPADSVVDVRFTALAEDRTKVVLTHRNWEAYGDMAEMMYGGYGSSWVMIF
jgi:hypothetical protein